MEESTVVTSAASNLAPPSDAPVLAQQRQALADYRINPVRVSTDAKGERREQSDYAERPLLELLQNAEDALADAEREGAVLLDLSNGRLLVANQGAPFTARGFQALCTLHNSPKPADRRCRFIGSKGTGFKAVLNWSDTPEIFSGPIHARFDREESARLIESAIGESGRKKLEENQEQPWSEIEKPLLQVPIAAEPDAEIRWLQREGWATIIRLPIRLDWPDKVENAVDELDPRQLLFLKRISRVIVTREGVTKNWELRRVRKEHPPGITCEEVEIKLDGRAVATWQLIRQTLDEIPMPGGRTGKESAENGCAEVALGIQTDGLDDEDRPARVCNFFPTQIDSPLPKVAVHGSFLLKGDRNHLTSDEPEYQERLIDALCALIQGRFLQQLVEQQGAGALQYLAPGTTSGGAENDIERALFERLIDAVKTHPFIPILGDRTEAPVNVRTWSHGLGRLLMNSGTYPPEPSLPMPDWCERGASEVLKKLGGKELGPDESLRLLRDWVPATDTDALDGLNLAASALRNLKFEEENPFTDDLKQLKEQGKSIRDSVEALSVWKTQNGRYRSMKESTPFFEPKGDQFQLPTVIPIDRLCGEYRKLAEEQGLWHDPRLTEMRRKHIHPATPEKIIEHAVLPAVEEKPEEWWTRHGFEILDAFQRIKPVPDDVDDDVFASPLRLRVAKAIRVPIRRGGWQPAGEVWAGADHGYPAGETIAANRTDPVPLLASTEQYPVLSGKEPLLRYLGVSWAPKWRQHVRGERDYLHGSTDKLAAPPQGLSRFQEWRQYFEDVLHASLDEDGKRHPGQKIGCWAIQEAWAVAGLDAFCREPDKSPERLKRLAEIWRRFPNRRIVKVVRQGERRGKLKGGAGIFRSGEDQGFLHWQISHAEVFDIERSPLWSSSRAKLADLLLSSEKRTTWERWLPRLVLKRQADDVESAELHQFAKEFGAKTRLEDFQAKHWLQWLEALAKCHWPTDEQTEGDLSGFLRNLADADPAADLKSWVGDVRLPCLAAGDQVIFRPLDELVVIDQAHYKSLRQPLIEADKAVLLVVSPVDGKKLLGRLGRSDRGLSKLLRATVASTPVFSSTLSETINQSRPLVLALIAHLAKSKASAKRLNEDWPTSLQLHRPLGVHLVLGGQNLGTHPQEFLWDDETRVLHVDRGSDGAESVALEHVAFALANRAGSPEARHALVRLFEKAETSVNSARDFLLRDGLSQHDIDEWTSLGSSGVRDGPDSITQDDAADDPTRHPSIVSEDVESRNSHEPAVGEQKDATTPPETETVRRGDSGNAEENEAVGDPRQGIHAKPRSGSSRPSSGQAPGAPPELSQRPTNARAKHSETPSSSQPKQTDRGQQASKSGAEGEAWLRAALQDLLAADFAVSDRPDGSGGGESDIVISRDGSALLHVEVKTMQRDVFWSEGEVKKARTCAEGNVPYVIAVLIPNRESDDDADDGTESDYRVGWIADPLNRLRHHWDERAVSIRWYWSEQTQRLQDLPPTKPWTPPKRQPKKRPSRTSYIFRPKDEDYDGVGLKHVLTYLRLDQPNSGKITVTVH